MPGLALNFKGGAGWGRSRPAFGVVQGRAAGQEPRRPRQCAGPKAIRGRKLAGRRPSESRWAEDEGHGLHPGGTRRVRAQGGVPHFRGAGRLRAPWRCQIEGTERVQGGALPRTSSSLRPGARRGEVWGSPRGRASLQASGQEAQAEGPGEFLSAAGGARAKTRATGRQRGTSSGPSVCAGPGRQLGGGARRVCLCKGSARACSGLGRNNQ